MATEARITCLCGKNEQILSLPSSLPVETTACCCSSCRYSTGVLYIACLLLESGPKNLDDLVAYHSSQKLSRHFCAFCGSHMFIHHNEEDTWLVCSGAIDNIIGSKVDVEGAGLEKLLQHEFVEDTIDGGIAICLLEIDGRPVRFFAQGPNESPLKDAPNNPADPISVDLLRSKHPRLGSIEQDGPSEYDRLHASCHCGAVQFSVTRPGVESRRLISPFPDLLVPYHSSSSANPDDVKWWLRDGGTKYLAGTCACRSCRLASGFPIQAWAFVPKLNLQQMDGSRLSFSKQRTKQHESSPGIFREFCSSCGATIFWHCNERPDLIDVSVGLLRAKEGTRARSWLSWWTERVSFKEDAFDKKLINALERGLTNIAVQVEGSTSVGNCLVEQTHIETSF